MEVFFPQGGRFFHQFRGIELQTQHLSFCVQIDESLFAKRKYVLGKKWQQRWVFGACDHNREGQVYMVTFPKRNEANLLPIIQSWCPSGSIINSDCWGAYRNGFCNYCNSQLQ